jgi:kynurenine formamidase
MNGGTHAPLHFVEKKHSTDEIPLSQLIAPAVVIDVTRQADSSADYRVHQSDITAWEDAHGDIAPGTIVLIRTGWGRRWPDRQRYLGTLKTGPAAVAELHFPGLDLDAARALVRRRVAAVGCRRASITAVDVPGAPAVARPGAGVRERGGWAASVTGAFVVALPMKIKGGSGGPLRIVGLLP